MKIKIAIIALTALLAGCVGTTVADIKNQAPMVAHVTTDYETTYRSVSRLLRECYTASMLGSQSGVDADIYPGARTGEVTIWFAYPARHTASFTEITAEDAGSVVRIWGNPGWTRNVQQAVAGKSPCSE